MQLRHSLSSRVNPFSNEMNCGIDSDKCQQSSVAGDSIRMNARAHLAAKWWLSLAKVPLHDG